MTHLRWRLARWLVGGNFVTLPGPRGAAVVTWDGPATVLIVAETLTVRTKHDLSSRAFGSTDKRYLPSPRSGIFEGTF